MPAGGGEADRPDPADPAPRGEWAAAPEADWDPAPQGGARTSAAGGSPRASARGGGADAEWVPPRDAGAGWDPPGAGADWDPAPEASGSPDWDSPPRTDRGGPPRADRGAPAEAPQRPDWVASPDWDAPPPDRPARDAAFQPPDRRAGWDRAAEPTDRRAGWDGGPKEADRRTAWDDRPDEADRRDGWNGGPEEADRHTRWDDRPDEADRRSGWNGGPEEADRRTRWDGAGPEEADRRNAWDDGPDEAERRGGWDRGPEGADPRTGWDRGPDQADRRRGWDGGPDRHGGRAGDAELRSGPGRDTDHRNNSRGSDADLHGSAGPGHDTDHRNSRVGDTDLRSGGGQGRGTDGRNGRGGDAERKERPDWLTSPVPATPPDGGWTDAEPSDNPVPEAWPAPLDITPDDDLDEPPAKRRRGPRPSGPPTDGRSGGRPGGRPGGRGPRGRRKPLMILAVALTAAVAAAAIVAAGTIYRLVFDGGTPGLHTIAAPLGGRTTGELTLASGAETVTVRGADLGEDLFQITTPDSDDAIPRATIQGDRTTVRLTSDRGEGATAVEIRLNSRVTWRVVLNAGARTHTVDMGAGRLAGLEVAGGATKLELTLPKPSGTVPIRLRGGLEELLMHVPQGALTRVKVTKGATNVTLDRLNRSKVAPDTTFTPKGWEEAKARYDVDAAEGIGTVRLDRR
ncbi:hypothetical protein [Phytohabitans suffuscus]